MNPGNVFSVMVRIFVEDVPEPPPISLSVYKPGLFFCAIGRVIGDDSLEKNVVPVKFRDRSDGFGHELFRLHLLDPVFQFLEKRIQVLAGQRAVNGVDIGSLGGWDKDKMKPERCRVDVNKQKSILPEIGGSENKPVRVGSLQSDDRFQKFLQMRFFSRRDNFGQIGEKLFPGSAVFSFRPYRSQSWRLENQSLVLVKKTLIRAQGVEKFVKSPPWGKRSAKKAVGGFHLIQQHGYPVCLSDNFRSSLFCVRLM
jgi:hypothetical protein